VEHRKVTANVQFDRNEFESLVDLFTTQSPARNISADLISRRISPGETMTLVGGTAADIGLWIPTVACRFADADGPTALIRFGHKHVTIDLLRSHELSVPVPGVAEISAWIPRIAPHIQRWLICPGTGNSQPESMAASTELLMVVGLGDSEAVAAYLTLKRMRDDALQHGTPLPRVNIVVVGAPHEQAPSMASPLIDLAHSLRGVHIDVVESIPWINPARADANGTYAASEFLSVSQFVQEVNSAQVSAAPRSLGSPPSQTPLPKSDWTSLRFPAAPSTSSTYRHD
jgi:hypothetical protein